MEETAPRNDKEWAVVSNSAAAIVESGNLLLLRDRAIDNGDWVKMTREFIDASRAALTAAEAKVRRRLYERRRPQCDRATTAMPGINGNNRTIATAALTALLLGCPSRDSTGMACPERTPCSSWACRDGRLGPLLYLGAKHMVTGYDHLLFLVGVIFFLYRLKDVVQYVSLFTIGHSVTLLVGVLGGVRANPYLIDAIIGFSVVYKAFENMDGFRRFFGFQPNTQRRGPRLRLFPRLWPRHQAAGFRSRRQTASSRIS